MRTWPLLFLLSGCVISQPPAEPPPVKIVTVPAPLPAPVRPDACVGDWYAKAKLPPCVESWISELTNQQNKIEKKAGK